MQNQSLQKTLSKENQSIESVNERAISEESPEPLSPIIRPKVVGPIDFSKINNSFREAKE